MGGILTWVLRKECGETHVMRRFTNPMPGIVKTPEFLRGEKHAVNDAVMFWLNYKADWEAHKDNGGFEYASSRALTPYPAPFAPYDYGLIATDFVTKTFLSCQGYSRLDSMLDMELSYPDSHPDDLEGVRALRQAGLISHHRLTAPGAGLTDLALDTFADAHLDEDGRLIFPSTIAFADLKKFCHANRRTHSKIGWITAEISVPGLTFQSLPEMAPGNEIREALSALGFSFTASDLEAFAEWDRINEEAA